MSEHDCTHGCSEYNRLSRRRFLGLSGGALVVAAVPSWLPRVAFAQSHASRDVIVSIFLRGGADGLTLCVPHGDAAYYPLRPTLAVAPPDSTAAERATDLDGFFGLPPALAPLLPAYQDGNLLFVHACGLTDATRSHFSAMYFMEVGQPQPPATLFSGWLGRHLATVPPLDPAAPLRGVGLGFGLPRTLVGAPATVPVADPAEVGFAGNPASLADRRGALDQMWNAVPDDFLRLAAHSTRQTVDLLEAIDFPSYQPSGGAVYPEGEFGYALSSVAAMIKADVGLEAAAVDLGGWDTHDFQGPLQGQMFRQMQQLGQGLAAFHADLFADGRTDVVVTAQSEFGRNAFENASAGTDHGHGGVMMVLGGHVAGGRVLTEWPGLAAEQLYEGQDLAITIDYRDVLSEIVTRRLGNPDVRNVFPDPAYTPVERGVVLTA